MHIEIQKNIITTMEGEDVVRYEVVPMDETLEGNLDDLRMVRDFLDSYIEKEEGKIPTIIN